MAMGKYVFVYTGGAVADTEEEAARVMAEWVGWFEGVGTAIVDAGNPFTISATVAGDGAPAASGSSGLTGYSIVAADSLDQAVEIAGSCPVLGAGGTIEVYETVSMMPEG